MDFIFVRIENMTARLQTGSHLHHPALKTVAGVCFDCVTQILSTAGHSTIWQVGVVMDDLHMVFSGHASNFKQMVGKETRSWTVQLTQLILGGHFLREAERLSD